jgi:hypothetical protein
MDDFQFHSDLFAIEPGEDAEVNPGLYGRQLAQWLKAQLEARGYTVEPIIAEDWGRCLMLAREPFALWVGCGNMMDGDAREDDALPAQGDITWTCFATAEVPLLRRLFGRKPDTAPALAKLNADLEAILRGEPRIRLVEGS